MRPRPDYKLKLTENIFLPKRSWLKKESKTIKPKAARQAFGTLIAPPLLLFDLSGGVTSIWKVRWAVRGSWISRIRILFTPYNVRVLVRLYFFLLLNPMSRPPFSVREDGSFTHVSSWLTRNILSHLRGGGWVLDACMRVSRDLE